MDPVYGFIMTTEAFTLAPSFSAPLGTGSQREPASRSHTSALFNSGPWEPRPPPLPLCPHSIISLESDALCCFLYAERLARVWHMVSIQTMLARPPSPTLTYVAGK